MKMHVYASAQALAVAAAEDAAQALRSALSDNQTARVIAATGAAQFEFLELLTAKPGIDWERVELFHLDEYIGLPDTHNASFVRFLRERLVAKTGIRTFHALSGTADPAGTIRTVTTELRKEPVDLAFIGIGENGHLAFNDPPAVFETAEAFLVVQLDDACRQQQFGEGWFPTFDTVPQRAITMTVPEILRARRIFAIVPESRKAKAVAECFEGDITAVHPASILRTHDNATLYLDRDSAGLLSPQTLERYS